MRSIIVIVACGCGASIGPLAEQGDYRGAVCEWEEQRDDLAALERHLEPELELRLHVHALDPAGARALFERELPGRFHERAAVLRLHYVSRNVPIEWFDVVPGATVEGRTVNVAPDRPALAALLGEELPEPRRVRRRYGGNGLAVLLLAMARPLRFAAGESIPHVGGRRVTNYVPPTDAEVARVAPATQQIHEQLAQGCTTSGVHCERFFVVPRTNEEITLIFTRRLATLSPDVARPFACSAQREFEVTLPLGETLEQRLAARFGSGLQPIGQVTQRGAAY